MRTTPAPIRKLYSALLLLALITFAAQDLAAEEVLLSWGKGKLSLSVFRGEDGRTVVEARQTGIAKAAVFAVENPSRIAIDLFGVTASQNYKLSPKKNAVFKDVRIAGHPDKIRIVLDLALAGSEPFNWTQSPGAVTVFIGKAGTAAVPTATIATLLATPSLQPAGSPPPVSDAQPAPEAAVTVAASTPTPEPSAAVSPAASAPSPTSTPEAPPAFIPEAPRSPAPASTVDATPTPLATATPAETATMTAAATETPTATSIAVIAPSVQTLNAINFENGAGEKSALIRLSLTQRPQFRLSKKDDRTWLLSVTDAVCAAPHLNLVQYPPENVPGFTFIQASQNASRLDIVIGVERGGRISAVTKDTDILIRPLPR